MSEYTEDQIEVVLDEHKPDVETETVDDPVGELNRQFEALKRDNEKRKEAEAAAHRRAADLHAAADQSRQEAATARAALADRETETVESRIAAAQSEAEAAKAEFIAAAEAGDYKKQGEAQWRISQAAADLANFKATKAELELRKSVPNEAQVARRAPSDPFEDHLRQFTPRTAEWLREHREWVASPSKNSELVGAHHRAVREGHAPDSDGYFSFVEKFLGIGEAEEQPPVRTNGAGNAKPQSARRASPMVAPVNGGGGAHSSGSGDVRSRNTVVLTKGEAERATDGSIVWNAGNADPKTGEPIKPGDPRIGKPIGTGEYARRKQQLDRGGFYDKTYSHG